MISLLNITSIGIPVAAIAGYCWAAAFPNASFARAGIESDEGWKAFQAGWEACEAISYIDVDPHIEAIVANLMAGPVAGDPIQILDHPGRVSYTSIKADGGTQV